MMIENY